MINKKFLAFVLAVVLLLSIGCVMSQKQTRPDIDKSKVNAPKAKDITTVFVDVPVGEQKASAGNSEALDIELRVKDNVRDEDLDELKEGDFEIQTRVIPPGAPSGYSLQIEPKSFRIVNADCREGPSEARIERPIEEDCIPNIVTYGMGLIPELPSGDKGTWRKGDYHFYVKYLMGGYEDLSRSVFFRIEGNSS